MSSWHSGQVEDLLKQFESSPSGISEQQAQERLKENGFNQLAAQKKPNLLLRVLVQMKDPMILVLLAAAALSFWASGGEEWLDAAIILMIVCVNQVISISQEDKAQQALEALKNLSAPQATVVRGGTTYKIPAAELVTGDIIHLEAGDYVPADARILQCSRLQADESSMTGESVPVEKFSDAVVPPDAPLGDWVNMVLSGTLITAGHATALVCATGMDTQMGHIARLLLNDQGSETPLQKKMGEISKTLSFVCLCVCAVMFGVGLIQGKNMLDMFMTAVSLAVAAIPEGLPAIVTIVLALGVGRMAQRGAIVKRLPAVETLGCASVICSDKTGTLTQNQMAVQELWVPRGGHRREAFIAGTLCSDAQLFWRAGGPTAQGDPTETALVIAAAKEGIDRNKLGEEQVRKADIPFDSQRKLMSTIHSKPEGGYRVYVKGAPDVLLNRCKATGKGQLSGSEKEVILEANEKMAARALRVLGVAYRDLAFLPAKLDSQTIEQELTFLGLFGLMDPPRSEVKEAVLQCHRAGIRPVMITGDHRATAVAVAKELSIYQAGDLAITGADLDFMPQEVLEEDIHRFSVFARVTPEHKMRIVKAWQKKNQVVAMTGDGVNDAPALKASDIGCAMGKSGTDVAKGAADMILTDDNFSTIVKAVEEGRGIYANIKKAIHYLLSCNIGEMVTIFVATAFNFGQMPLVPVQLLWLNLVTDSLPALALGVEEVEHGVMEQPPRQTNQNLFDQAFSMRLLWQGLMVGALTLCAYFLGLVKLAEIGREGAVANTMAFATLTLCQLCHAFNVRSEEQSLFHQGVWSNASMNRAFLIGLGLQLGVLLLPPAQAIFSVVPLNGIQWTAVALLALAPIPICEIEKKWRGKKHTEQKEQRVKIGV